LLLADVLQIKGQRDGGGEWEEKIWERVWGESRKSRGLGEEGEIETSNKDGFAYNWKYGYITIMTTGTCEATSAFQYSSLM